jgi:hypothetical protein
MQYVFMAVALPVVVMGTCLLFNLNRYVLELLRRERIEAEVAEGARAADVARAPVFEMIYDEEERDGMGSV